MLRLLNEQCRPRTGQIFVLMIQRDKTEIVRRKDYNQSRFATIVLFNWIVFKYLHIQIKNLVEFVTLDSFYLIM